MNFCTKDEDVQKTQAMEIMSICQIDDSLCTNMIAAQLKRSFADGIQWAAEHWASSLEDEEKRLRSEADLLDRSNEY